MAAQLALDQRWTVPARPIADRPSQPHVPQTQALCASCRAREARYGFCLDRDNPQLERPRTLCFECFRVEIRRRQEAAHVFQVRLPLEQTLDALDRRRRRAQIAARHALVLR